MTKNNQGWNGDSKGHADAARGQSKDKDIKKTPQKDIKIDELQGQGWHGDSEGHRDAAKDS